MCDAYQISKRMSRLSGACALKFQEYFIYIINNNGIYIINDYFGETEGIARREISLRTRIRAPDYTHYAEYFA